jgi:hypothetical protein
MNQSQPVWNSLEVVKLLISLLTPLILLVVGIWVARMTERFRLMMWSNQKVIEKRIEIYGIMAPLLNDLYCYYVKVGSWKKHTPPEIVEMKRKLDKTIYIYAALFSQDLTNCYFRFIHICFETYTGPGQDAKLRTYINDGIDDRRQAAQQWDDEWDKMFSDKVWEIEAVKDAYQSLMSCFANELGIGIRK